MRHLVLMLIFAAMISAFFALLVGRRGRRLRLGLTLFLGLAGGAVIAGYLMFLFA